MLQCVRLSASMELWIEPSGPVLEGSTVRIHCLVTRQHALDVVRLVRVVDGEPYELTTNELLSATFRDTGRYSIVEYDAQRGLVTLQISRMHAAFISPHLVPPHLTSLTSLYPPSERSETGGDYVFTFVCLCAPSPIGLNGRNAEKCIQLVREKLRIFPYGQYIVGIYVSLAF